MTRSRRVICVEIVVFAALLLTSGCAQETTSEGSSKPTKSGVTAEQRAALRSMPASEPMTGPTVPGLVNVSDVQDLTGITTLKIEARN